MRSLLRLKASVVGDRKFDKVCQHVKIFAAICTYGSLKKKRKLFRIISTPHLVKKEFVVRSHRKSISPEVISYASGLIDIVDILTVVKKESPDFERSSFAEKENVCGCVVAFLVTFVGRHWIFGL